MINLPKFFKAEVEDSENNILTLEGLSEADKKGKKKGWTDRNRPRSNSKGTFQLRAYWLTVKINVSWIVFFANSLIMRERIVLRRK